MYKMYEKDFRLFGYDIEPYLSIAKEDWIQYIVTVVIVVKKDALKCQVIRVPCKYMLFLEVKNMPTSFRFTWVFIAWPGVFQPTLKSVLKAFLVQQTFAFLGIWTKNTFTRKT